MRPDLAVIDEAIRIVNNRSVVYTCVALDIAASKAGCDLVTRVIYVDQYQRLIRGPGFSHTPIWWDQSYSDEYKRLRLEALSQFRQACIDAARKRK